MAHARRYCWQAQRLRLERAWRECAVRVVRSFRKLGGTLKKICELLRVSERTIRNWRVKLREHRYALPLRGRPPVRSKGRMRAAVIRTLKSKGAETPLRVLQEKHPKLARREVADILQCYRAQKQKSGRWVQYTEWTRSAVVWATDTVDLQQKVDGARYALTIVDLGSHKRLGTPTLKKKTGAQVARQLNRAFRRHGAPLVLKRDNGSEFANPHVDALLEEWGVVSLPSPVRRPQYNGACEAHNGVLRKHVDARVKHARRKQWKRADLVAATRERNNSVRPWGPSGPTPNEAWARRRFVSLRLRERFQSAVRCQRELRQRHTRIARARTLAPNFQARLHRRVTVDALKRFDFLSIHRRRIHPPIKSKRTARIS